MGSRSNVVIKDGKSQVWLYGHWNGESYVVHTRKALARRARWDDAPYLSRMIFDALTDGHHGEETGFGISTSITDNEHPVLVVDVGAKSVYFAPEEDLADGRIPEDYPEDGGSWTFDEFIAQP